jgi:hypothetical protein
MKCPSCNFEQADSRLDCECCGLIFAKWKERHLPPAIPDPLPADSAEKAPPDSPDLENSPLFAEESSLESGIPDRPIGEPVSNDERPRLYEQIAALDLQQDREGNWIYFPWGVFGRGYRLKNPEIKNEIEGFLTRFCCVHSPMMAILGLAAGTLWIYNVEQPTEGISFLASYFVLAYLFLWIKIRQWTSKLPPSLNRLNQKQYYFLFFKIFNWRTLFDLEVISLLLVLSCLWIWLSEKWRWFLPADNVSILWMCLGFSSLLLVLFSFLYYFRKK